MGARTTHSLASEAEALAKITALERKRSDAQGTTLTAAIAAYLDHLRADGRAPGTVDTAGYRLHALLRDGERDRPVADLSPIAAQRLYALRVREGVAVDTHRGELATASAWGTWCAAQGWLRADPFARVEPVGRKRAGRGKPQLRVDEARTLIDYLIGLCTPAAQPEPVAVLAALLLGPRATEVVTRDVRDLDDDGRLLWIPDSKSDNGRRLLEVPEVLQPLLRALAQGRAGAAPLFLARDLPGARRKRGVRRATRHWLYYHCRRLIDDACDLDLSPHGLRRTHSTLARARGATGELVAAQLGHGSVAVQERSYVAPGAAEAGAVERVLRVLQGGRR